LGLVKEYIMIPKRIALLVVPLLIFLRLTTSAQTGDEIKGVWLSEKKDGKIEIFNQGNTYAGKLLWGKYVQDENGQLRHDVNNPDPKLRWRLLQGMVILTGLNYEDGKWQNGKIYDPLSGKTYNVTITVKGNHLELRGYIGISLLGKTTVWLRVN
jgi:uncharacterized protein (DUF2147 family)